MKKELKWLIIGCIVFGIGISLELHNQNKEAKNLKTETYETEASSESFVDKGDEIDSNSTTDEQIDNSQKEEVSSKTCTNQKSSNAITNEGSSNVTKETNSTNSTTKKKSSSSSVKSKESTSEEEFNIVEVNTTYSNNENNNSKTSTKEETTTSSKESTTSSKEETTKKTSIQTNSVEQNKESNSIETNSTEETVSTTNQTTNSEENIDTNNTITNNSNVSTSSTSTVTDESTSNIKTSPTMTSEYITLDKTIKYLEYQKSFQLKATLKNINGKITWSSSNSSIATVDNNGKVTAVGGGLAIITATVNGESTSCKVIAIRNSFKTLSAPWRTTATIYYDGNKKITYYFRRQNYNYACSSEKINGKEICTSGFKTWYANHGCATISTTAVVNAYLGKTSSNLISSTKMRMVYEKNEYNWTSKYSSDPYCNKEGNLNQFTRDRVAAVLNNQFNLSATAYTIASTSGNEAHIERITNALAEGRPVIIFVNASQAGTTKFTKGVHTLVMVGFADADGHVLVLDSSHNGFKEDTVEKMVNQYIGRGTSKYRGYIVLNEKKA